jgi:glutamate--cysteine ligase
MNQINSKQDLINFFKKGCKKESHIGIGVEHEKFIFENHSNKRINFEAVSKIFSFLEQFGWKPIKERNNVIGLARNEQNISLEPGNQIELSGAKLDSIHLVCKESYKFLDELKKACSKFNLKMTSVSFDPYSKLEEVPKTPKKRYEIMTEEMPKNGELSLYMMYQTCGTQINLDYISEKDFINKFKLSSFLVPISTAIFANSPVREKKLNGYLSYRSKVWQHTSRAGLPKIFLEEMDFEKYVDTVINIPVLFILKNSNYYKAEGKTFKDFMNNIYRSPLKTVYRS